MDSSKLKQINDDRAAQNLAAQRHADNQVSAIQTQETILQSFQLLIGFLKNQTSKTEVINQLESIGTPDALKVIPAIDSLHETLKTHKNTDLTELTGLMGNILDEAKKIPKALPKQKEQKFIDYTKQFKGLETAIKAIQVVVKQQKLIAEAPIVNVPAPNVHLEAPNYLPLQVGFKDVVKAVNKIVIPEYKTDNKAVEKLLKDSNKLLKNLLEKPVSSGGGGSSRVSPYQDSAGIPAFVTLNNGKIPVDATVTATIDTTGLATDTNQTSGAQKTQIVDSSGNAVTVTGNKLDVNATASLAGSSIPISGASTGVGVAILDSSGNQISSFGGGTQYTDGGTPPTHAIGSVPVYDNGGTWKSVSTSNRLPVSVPLGQSNMAGSTSVAIASDQGAIGTVGTTSAVVNVGQKTVNTTAVQISSSSTIPTNGILIGGLSTNSASIFIGGSGVSTTTGVELPPGAIVPFTANLNTLYIISAASTTDKIWFNIT